MSKHGDYDPPPMSFTTRDPYLQLIIMESTLISAGYSFKDIKEMTVDEVMLRSFVLSKFTMIMESRRPTSLF